MAAHSLDVEIHTEENYRARLRNHIVPRWEHIALGDITAFDVATWLKQVQHRRRDRRHDHAPPKAEKVFAMSDHVVRTERCATPRLHARNKVVNWWAMPGIGSVTSTLSRQRRSRGRDRPHPISIIQTYHPRTQASMRKK